ncbi:MAG: HEAT repeat domain-containing protein [Pseudoxanthomonas sp.]
MRPLVALEREPELQRGAALSVLQILARDPGALSEQGLLWARAALSDSDWVVRESAAVVLGDLKGAEAAALLSTLTGDREPRVRRSAMRALGRRDEHAAAPDPMVLSALHTGLQDSDLGVRQEALRALAKVARALVQKGTPGVLGELAGWLGGILSEGSPLEQVLARGALLAAGDTAQQAKLRELLQSPSAEVRRAALESLEPDKELLASLLQDSAAGVRLLAARRLAELGDRRAIAVLKEALAQGGATARMAQALLVRLGETLPPPADNGTQDPVEQRLLAVEALAGLPLEQAVAQLLIAARDHDASVRRRVATIAADLPGGGLQVLRQLLDDANPGVRALAAALLGRLQPAALPAAENSPVTEPSPGTGTTGRTSAAKPGATAITAPDAGVAEPPPSAAELASEPAAAPPGSIEEQAAQLTQSGVKLLQRHDLAKARQLFEKARHLCGRQKKSELCSSLQFESVLPPGARLRRAGLRGRGDGGVRAADQAVGAHGR